MVTRALAGRLWSRRSGPVAVRVGLGCAVIAGVCLAQLGSTSGADTAFDPGTASAGSQAILVAPTVASLSLGVILGTSLSDYINNEGQSLAQTFDGGALVTILTAANCATGAPGTLQPSDFPAPAQAESTNGNQSASATAYSLLNPTDPVGIGTETASATTAPSGTATNTIAGFDLGSLVSVSGATVNSVSEVLNGNTRYASATSDIAGISLAGGLVQLKGLHWVATQTSGATNTSTASFSISGLTVAGVTVPIQNDSVTTLLSILNTALSPLGLNIDWPAVSTLPDGTIQISNLKVGLDNSALGQQIVGPLLTPLQSARNTLQNEAFAINCETADAFSVSDIALGVVAGAGDLDVELGGAHALTNDNSEGSPFGSSGQPLSLGGSGSTSPSTSGFGTLGTSTTPSFTGGTTPTTGDVSTSGTQKVAFGPTHQTMSCVSLSTASSGCSGHNLGAVVGLIGLGLLGGLATFDYVRQRRRKRSAELGAP
jgi:hypothetical protein